MPAPSSSTILITCGRDLVPWLEQEVRALGFTPDSTHKTSLTLTGTLADCMRLNLCLRTAFEVLYLLDEFPCRDGDDLYRRVVRMPWDEWISPDEYLTVTTRVDTLTVNNSMFPSLKVKDAIVDRIARFQERGRRPDSGPDRNGIVITLYWKDDRARIYFNTTGQKLADRGYRRLAYKAPLRETIAAAALLATGYDGSQPLIAPMCGSGTFAIEAALIGAGRAPGPLRANYSMMHWRGFDREAWEALRLDLNKQARKHPRNQTRTQTRPAPIIASDIDPEAVNVAQRNAATAGVERLIDFHVCDFAHTPMPANPAGAIVIMNPEYGLRLGNLKALEHTYARIGDFFKTRCQGCTGWVFTGNLDLAKHIGLKPSRRIPFSNAEIECRLLKYEIYAGTRRKPAAGPSQPPIEA